MLQAGDVERAVCLLEGMVRIEAAEPNPQSEKALAIRSSLREISRSRILPLAMADLASGVPHRIASAGPILAALGQEAADHLASFAASGADERSRMTAVEVLAGMGPLGTRRYLEELSTATSTEAQRNLLGMVHVFRDDELWRHIEGLLDVEDPGFVRLLIHALSRSNKERAVPLLLPLLEREEVAIRRETLIALGKIGSDHCVAPLVRLLTDRGLLGKGLEDSLARETCIALGRIRSPRATEALIEVMKGNSRGPLRRGWPEAVRASAAWALGQINDPECHRALTEAAAHGRGPVRAVATQALQQVSAEPGMEQEGPR